MPSNNDFFEPDDPFGNSSDEEWSIIDSSDDSSDDSWGDDSFSDDGWQQTTPNNVNSQQSMRRQNRQTQQRQPQQRQQPQRSMPRNNGIDTEDETYWNNQQQFEAEQQNNIEKPKKKSNLSHKQVAFLLLILFIGIAIVIYMVSNIKAKPKAPAQQTQQVQQVPQQNNQQVPQQNNQQTNQQVSRNNQQVPQQTQQNSQQVPTTDVVKERQQQQAQDMQEQQVKGNVALIKVPDTVQLDYSQEPLKANAVVQEKKTFLQGNQVLYCVSMQVSVGTAMRNIEYYCNYGSFVQVNVGDLLVVEYQIPQNGYISVVSISK